MGTRYPLKASFTLPALQARFALRPLRARSAGQPLLTTLTGFATRTFVTFRALRAGFTLGALLALQAVNEKPLAAIPDSKLIGVAYNVNVARRGIGNGVESGTVVDLTHNL